MRCLLPLLTLLAVLLGGLFLITESSAPIDDAFLTPAPIEMNPPIVPPATTPTPFGVIFPADHPEAEGIARWIGLEADAYYTLTADAVASFEAGLPAYLAGLNDPQMAQESPPTWDDLARYKRQYLGFVRANQSLMIANFFCDWHWASSDGWTTSWVIVLDGGVCFFTILYDPAAQVYFDLRINGEA